LVQCNPVDLNETEIRLNLIRQQLQKGKNRISSHYLHVAMVWIQLPYHIYHIFIATTHKYEAGLDKKLIQERRIGLGFRRRSSDFLYIWPIIISTITELTPFSDLSAFLFWFLRLGSVYLSLWFTVRWYTFCKFFLIGWNFIEWISFVDVRSLSPIKC